MGLKREIALLVSEKGLEDLNLMTGVRFFGIHVLEGLLERVRWLDACERLGDAMLDGVTYPGDDGQV